MKQLVSWIRETDQELFAAFFALDPDLRVRNARLEKAALDEMGGLLVTGGPDISAPFHPQPLAHPELIQEPEPERDAWEFSAVHAAYERGLPILCICKGLQVLNLALGGTLFLDIRGHDLPEMKSANVQPLRFSAAARHRFPLVNSSHHQALDRVADALEVEAWHAEDEIIEQVRIRDFPWGRGVQFHPERDLTYAPLFADFFAQLKPSDEHHLHA